jgi:DNA-3-methyladenine glycosylase II
MQHIVHLSKDRKLKKIIAAQAPAKLVLRKQVWLHLCSSIMSQQLSTRVADVIYSRFMALYPRQKPNLALVSDTPVETLRSIGLSHAKAQYIHNVCAFFLAHQITDAKLYKMDNEAVIQLLVQIKGVGRWTVEMILMFSLCREDVFAIDDLGIQQAMTKLYALDNSNKKALQQQMLTIASKWSPYRTYACRYLWGWKDNTPK